MPPRLLALRCGTQAVSDAVQPHLHLLVNLRVLVLHMTSEMDSRALLPLHQLEYLQLRRIGSVSRNLLLVIRRLSVQHRLRHLSLKLYPYPPLNLAEMSGVNSGLAPAALVTLKFRLHGDLSDEYPSALLSLPSLTRLDWKGDTAVNQSLALSQSSLPVSPSPLQKLHLDFKSDERGAVHMLQLAATRAPQLRELRVVYLHPPSAH